MLELMGPPPLKTWLQHYRDRIREGHPKLGERSTIAMPTSEQILNSCAVGGRTESGKQLAREEVALPAETKIDQKVAGISSAINLLLPCAWLTPCYSNLHLKHFLSEEITDHII